MKANRITRVNEIIRRELATQMYRLAPRAGLDPGRVTVTHVQTAVDLRTAKVLVSVLGSAEQQEQALGALKRLRAEFQEVLRDNVMLRYTPHLQFTLDHSLEQGDRVLQLMAEMGLEGGEEEARTEARRDGGTEGGGANGELENDDSQSDDSQSGRGE
jgi:ribosome-binding factor A